MKFVNVAVKYKYPHQATPVIFERIYSVPADEPFPTAYATKAWGRDKSLPHDLVAFVGTEVRQPTHDHIQLPEGFAAIDIPGYFWDCYSQKLYSVKTGELREMKRRAWRSKSGGVFDGYTLSHKGVTKYRSHHQFLGLKPRSGIIRAVRPPKRPGSRWSS